MSDTDDVWRAIGGLRARVTELENGKAIAELEDAYDRVCDERDNARDMAIALMEIVVQCDVELEAESLTRLHPDG